MPKVLLIVVDACASRVVQPAMEQGRLPNFQSLYDAASLRTESIAVFPSITPAATAAIVTGHYPNRHGVPGAYWYDEDEKTVIYYGYDIWAVINDGIGDFVKDFVVRLNEQHLRAKTVFERAEASDLVAASLNYLVFHGTNRHAFEESLLLTLLAGGDFPQGIDGPHLLYFGDFVRTTLDGAESPPASDGGPLSRFGFNDRATADLLLHLVKERALPDFTLAYFPENDFRSHEVGPDKAVDALEKVDDYLGDLFDTYGGLPTMLEEVVIVLTGDHSQSDVVKDEEKAGIRLDQLLQDFSVADAGTPMSKENDLVICPNLRTAQIYFHTPTPQRLEQVVERLVGEPRIDQIVWTPTVFDGEKHLCNVRTRDRGNLTFWTGDDGAEQATDSYGTTWSWKGRLEAIDARLDDGKSLVYGDYPNAMERISTILRMPEAGHLWVTAQPGHELRLEHTQIHSGGGSHGSLHELDSLSPLWVAGAISDSSYFSDLEKMAVQRTMRTVDVAPICEMLLGLQLETQPGAPRVE